MPAPGVDWVSSLIVLGVALALGSFLVFRVFRGGSRGATTPSAAPLELRDLVGKRDALLQQLRELEDTASKRNPEQLARERYALELGAAFVLRDLERCHSAEAKQPARTDRREAAAVPGWLQRNPALKGFLWGAGSIVAVGLLFFFVSQSATERDSEGTVTGNTQVGGSGSPGPGGDPEEAELKSLLARNPDDLEARLALARVYLARQDMMGVWNETKYVLDRSPGEPRALSYQSLVRLAMGQPDEALEMLKQALETSPDLFDAYIHMSLVYARLGRLDEGEATIEEAVRRFPEQAELLQRLWREMRGADLAADASGPRETGAPAPAERAPEPRSMPPPEDRGLAGVIELDPSLPASIASGSAVFVTVRAAGGESPALAVNRINPSSFPVTFEIGSAHSMTGGPLPDRVLIEVRLDSDRNPATRDPGDPTARLDGVAAGSTALRLVLRR